MFDAIVGWSLQHRPLVIALTLAIVVAGGWSLAHLPVDAFPDTTPVQVQINTDAPALDPVEVEQQVTIPVEQALGGLPGLADVRSVSRFGLSQVVAVFEDGVDLWFARQLVAEALAAVQLAEGLRAPRMGPAATGLGEVLHYLVTGEEHGLAELTTLHDWVIRPQLLSVPGVTEVNTWGGELKQLHVVVDPEALFAYGLTLDDLIGALRDNNRSVGGGVLTRGGEMQLVHGIGLAVQVPEIESIVITAIDGVPVLVRDVAIVRTDHQIRRGAVTANGQGEVVLGLGFMVMGENPHDVTQRLVAALDQAASSLPEGVRVELLYDRTELVDEVIATVRENLMEGALLVIAVLFALLGSLRAGLIVAAAIPLAMLFSFSAMLQTGIAASLLSLGAIDFGLVVDSSVIIVENCVRRLGLERATRSPLEVVRDATLEVRKPTMFGELIILVVYVPVLLLEGVEGRLFRPMALTVIFALMGSLVLSLTLVPVLCSYFLRGRAREGREGREGHSLVMRAAHALYRPVVRMALRWPRTILLVGVLLLVGGGLAATRLGGAFVPRLWEQAITINTVRLAGISLDESVRYGSQLERLLLAAFPDEIQDIWSRTGTAEVATDPMGIEVTDVFITLTPRDTWSLAQTQEDLVAAMQERLAVMPGMRAVFTQPIEMRLNEMTAGVRADLGVMIFGDDLERLRAQAEQVAAILESVPGAGDVAVEQLTGQPVLEAEVRREALARHGVSARTVLDIVAGLGEIDVGDVRDGQRRFDLVVRLPDRYRSDAAAVRSLQVPTAGGALIPLQELVEFREVTGPSVITRQWGKRRAVVQVNARGRDLSGFVGEARDRIARELDLPPGTFVRYGGQFEHLERASTQLLIVVPLALGAILFLLFLSTNSIRDSLVIATGVPFAALGGVVALLLRDMPFTISAAVGFVAVAGVSMLNGLVLVSTIRRMVDEHGQSLRSAIEETRLLRLRPILMTALVAALGFVPMALNTGVGAEVQRPLATVVIGGVIADNLLTLLVLPALYLLVGRRAQPSP
jgi:cobalt-zinc-cadmium resistance protein CzcA